MYLCISPRLGSTLRTSVLALGTTLLVASAIGCKPEGGDAPASAKPESTAAAAPATAARTADPAGATAAKAKGGDRVMKGTLKHTKGKTSVVAKTKDGKKYAAKIDPKTHEFTLTVPAGEAAVVAVTTNGKTKRMKFTEHNPKKGGQQKTTMQLPGDAFTGTAALGVIDFASDDDFVIVGDGAEEISVFNYIDSDGDGVSDWEDVEEVVVADEWIGASQDFDDANDFVGDDDFVGAYEVADVEEW